MTKHSPAPWIVSNRGYVSTPAIYAESEQEPYGTPVAVCPQRSGHPMESDPITDANARLIAAAPDLLEACKSLMGRAFVGDRRRHDDPLWAQARAAISRAEGVEA